MRQRWRRARPTRLAAIDRHRRPLPTPVTQDNAHLTEQRKTRHEVGSEAFLAAKRVSEQFSRVHWQANEFRSSQNALCAPWGPFSGEYETFKGSTSIDSVVKTTESHASQDWRALSFRNHYSETRLTAIGDPGTTPKLDSLPTGPSGLLRNSICCQHDPRGRWASRPRPPPSQFLTSTRARL